MTKTFAVCPECGRRLQVRDDTFPRHERGAEGKCAASGADATAQVNVWMIEEMHRLRARIERRVSWWERDARVLSVLEASARKRDCRWTLTVFADGCFQVACTGTRDEIVAVQLEMARSLGPVLIGRGFAIYDPDGGFWKSFPATITGADGDPVKCPASLALATVAA